MREASKHRIDFEQQTEDQRIARERMALFPEKGEVLFVNSEIWVVSVCSRDDRHRLRVLNSQPVVRLEGKLCILPGIPGLFQRLLQHLTPYLPLPPPSERPFRHLVFTK